MAIQISGCTVIDNSRNITNANNMCVGVVTMTGSTGNIETPGTITAGGLDFPISVVSFSPADGATNIASDGNIVITFNQFVQKPTTGIGTTAVITLRNSSGIGTVIQTIGITSTSVQVNGAVVTINPPINLPPETNVYVVIDANAFNSPGGNSSLINTYDYTTAPIPPLGGSYEGGFLICCPGSSILWIVAPSASEVSSDWFSRDNAKTTAQSLSGCTGWFVPTVAQLQNPGYGCRTYWDSFSSDTYWSSTECNATRACFVNFVSGAADFSVNNSTVRCVRAFRCATY
jgi:hypothetical protein